MPNHTKIIHLSVVHFPYDPRVVYRESFSLSKRFKASVIIPNADASLNPDIDFVSLPFFSQTWLRILFVHPVAFWHCLRIWPSVIHIHDAELLPLAFFMRFFGVKIIYDVHENLRSEERRVGKEC